MAEFKNFNEVVKHARDNAIKDIYVPKLITNNSLKTKKRKK